MNRSRAALARTGLQTDGGRPSCPACGRLLQFGTDRQGRTTDLQQRLSLIREFEKRVLDEQAYQFHILWWERIVPHWKRVQGWKITPNHYVNQDLRDVWLAPA